MSLAPGERHGALQPVGQQGTVRQAGEEVMLRRLGHGRADLFGRLGPGLGRDGGQDQALVHLAQLGRGARAGLVTPVGHALASFGGGFAVILRLAAREAGLFVDQDRGLALGQARGGRLGRDPRAVPGGRPPPGDGGSAWGCSSFHGGRPRGNGF